MGQGERPERQALVALGWVWRGVAVLLVRRHDPSLPAAHGRWELPGGKVAFGEDPAATVAREVAEETGYAVAVGPPLPYVDSVVWEYPDRRQHVVLLVYSATASERRVAPTDPRVAEVAWRHPDEINPTTALPSVGAFLRWWRAQGRSGDPPVA